MNHPRLGITCPIYINNWSHRDFLNQTTESIAYSGEYVWIPVQNYVAPQFLPYPWHFTQAPNETHIVEGRQPQSVARAWNDGIARAVALGCEYILVINDDIVLKRNAIDRLVAFAGKRRDAVLWSMGQWNDFFTIQDAPEDETSSEHPNFSSFMVHKSFPETFGRFDENFVPAYLEDNDCHARIALANQKAYVYGGARFFHFGSRTMAVDEDLRDYNRSLAGTGGRYFAEKWGSGTFGEVDQMRQNYYPHPYNEDDKPLSYWREPA